MHVSYWSYRQKPPTLKLTLEGALVTVDSLRADHLGCYGYVRPTSANLDALAERACVFESAWAPGPNTPHSLPGLLASRMAFESLSFGVGQAPLTLAEMLHSAGYRTQGFVAGNAYLSAYFGYDRGFDELVDFLEFTRSAGAGLRFGRKRERVAARIPRPLRLCHDALHRAGELVKSSPPLLRLATGTRRLWGPLVEPAWHRGLLRMKENREEAFAGPMLAWLDRNAAEPFFLWVHSMAVHDPYVPPAECQQAVSGRVISFRRAAELRRKLARVRQENARRVRRDDLRDLIALYDGEIRRADELLGRAFRVLKERGQWDSSLIIVTADHGEQLMERGGLKHPCSHYNELLRVPLVVRLPGQRRGRRLAGQVGLVDVMPTLAELLGIELAAGTCVGTSFAPALGGEGGDSDGRLYVAESFYGERGMVYNVDWNRLWSYGRRVSLQNRRLKLIVDCSLGECRAYDLRRDPAERRDLVPGNPELGRIGRSLARLHLRGSERTRIHRRFRDQGQHS